MVCDTTKEDDCGKLADLAIEKFGCLNLVAPCAGIIRDGLLVAPDRETGKVTKKMALENFQAVIDINLTGVFLTVRECAERMINHGCQGLICLFSSTSSLGTAGQINYSSTKAAMSVMPKVITAELFRRGLAGQNPVRRHCPRLRRHPHGKRHEAEGPGRHFRTGAHRPPDRTGGSGLAHRGTVPQRSLGRGYLFHPRRPTIGIQRLIYSQLRNQRIIHQK